MSKEILCERMVKMTDHSKLLKPIINKYTHGAQTHCSETNPENCRLLLLIYRLFYMWVSNSHTALPSSTSDLLKLSALS